jgi:TetR/AcrR family transcriptional repressor of bet genes
MAHSSPAHSTRPDQPAKPRARRQAPDERRQALLDVTIACLAQLGPRATTGREICRQAGVSHGLLRHYFDNPDNLLLEAYQDICDRFLARVDSEIGQAEDDPRFALDRMFATLFSEEWASSDVFGAWIAFWTLVRTNPDFAAVGEDHNRRLGALLAAALTRLPETPGRMPIADIAAILLAVMDGLWLDFCLSPGRASRERAIDLCRATLHRLV